MDDHIKEYGDYLTNVKKRSINTISAYTGDICHFMGFLTKEGIESSHPERINFTNIMAYLFDLEREGASPATAGRRLSSIKSFFRFLVKKRYIYDNPAEDIEAPPASKKDEGKPSSAIRIDKILNAASGESPYSKRDAAMLESGVKAGEIVGMKMNEIGLGYIKLCKRHKPEKIVSLNEAAWNALHEYVKDYRNHLAQDGEDAVFVNRKGFALTRQGLWHIVKNYAPAAGTKVSPEVLRKLAEGQ